MSVADNTVQSNKSGANVMLITLVNMKRSEFG